MKNHATHVVLSVEQQLQHGFCLQNRKKNAQNLEKREFININWGMAFVNSMGNHAPHVAVREKQ